MERTEHKITLDVHKTVSTTSVSVKKGDTAHRLLIILSEGGYPYHIGEDCTAVFSAVKPDGTTIWNDCTISGDVVIYDFTEQTTAALGVTNCEIQIYDPNGALLTSASFLLFVEDGASNRSAVVSSDEFGQLRDMIADVNWESNRAHLAADRANKAAGACMVIGSASGETIRLDDAIDAEFAGMRIFGKTTQNGTPTPANPATLVSVGAVGNINLTSTGKNLIPYPYYPAEPTLNGVTYTDNKDGSITVSGTATGYSGFWFTGYNFRLRKGITYTLSAHGDFTVTGRAVLTVTSTKSGVIKSFYLNSSKYASFTATDNYTDVAIYMYVPEAGNAITGTIMPQLEVGAVATQYEPYKGATIAIPIFGGLPGIPVASGGNYTDANGQQWVCDEIDLGRGVYVQRIFAEAVTTEKLYGVDNTYASKSGAIAYCKLTYDTHHDDSIVIAVSDRAKGVSSNERGDNGNIYRCYIGTGTTAIAALRYPISAGEKTVDEARADFVGATIAYIMAEPIETDLPDEVLDAYADYIRSYSGDTVVSNDAGAHMALEYIMDARKYIDKMISTGIHEATLE